MRLAEDCYETIWRSVQWFVVGIPLRFVHQEVPGRVMGWRDDTLLAVLFGVMVKSMRLLRCFFSRIKLLRRDSTKPFEYWFRNWWCSECPAVFSGIGPILGSNSTTKLLWCLRHTGAWLCRHAVTLVHPLLALNVLSVKNTHQWLDVQLWYFQHKNDKTAQSFTWLNNKTFKQCTALCESYHRKLSQTNGRDACVEYWTRRCSNVRRQWVTLTVELSFRSAIRWAKP